jgi:hypothetical protein
VSGSTRIASHYQKKDGTQCVQGDDPMRLSSSESQASAARAELLMQLLFDQRDRPYHREAGKPNSRDCAVIRAGARVLASARRYRDIRVRAGLHKSFVRLLLTAT